MSVEQREEERRYEEAAEERVRRLESRVLEDPLRVLRRKEAVIAGPDDRLDEVVERMVAARQGCALVVDRAELAGIFTERDALTRVLARGRGPSGLRMRDVMTQNPHRLTLDDSVGFALREMSVGGFRHLPVVDAQGKPVGVLSQQEAVQYLVGFFPEEVINQPPRSLAQHPPRHQHGG